MKATLLEPLVCLSQALFLKVHEDGFLRPALEVECRVAQTRVWSKTQGSSDLCLIFVFLLGREAHVLIEMQPSRWEIRV